jgi:NarL family two-component system response regulator LiaR
LKRTIIIYGFVLALAIALLKMLEYRFFYRQLSVELYIGIIGVLFTALGIWAGQKITRKNKLEAAALAGFKPDDEVLARTGISRREYEVLELMARGLSNQEIADRLFISVNTVKTHTANLFLKLEAKRRTQAVLQAKKLGLVP